MRYRDYLNPQDAERQEEQERAFSATENLSVSIPIDGKLPEASDVLMPVAPDITKGAEAFQKVFPLAYAHIADNANLRFLMQRLDFRYEPEEGFEVTEKDIEGYEDFPQLLWATSPADLAEYKRIADDIRYQRAYKETRGFWANLAAGFADPTAWASGLLGGWLVRGVTSASVALAKAFHLSLKVNPTFGTVSKAVAGGAVSAEADILLHDTNDRDVSRAVQNATAGGILGGAFAIAPELVKAIGKAGKSALFRRQVQETVDAMVPDSPQAGVVTNQGTFEQAIGAVSPSIKLANNTNPLVREKASELTARSFDVYDKQGNIVPQKTPVNVVVDASLSEFMYGYHKDYGNAFNAWVKTTRYGWIVKKFPSLNFNYFKKTARQEFEEFLFNAKLHPDANGKCHTGIAEVDLFLENQANRVNKLTKDAWDAGVYNRQKENYEKKVLDEVSDVQKHIDDYDRKGEKLEARILKLEKQRDTLEKNYEDMLENTNRAEAFLSDNTERGLSLLEAGAVKKVERITKEAKQLGEASERQRQKLLSTDRKLNFDYAKAAVRGWFRGKDGTVAGAKDVTALRVLDDELGVVRAELTNLGGRDVRIVTETGYEQLSPAEQEVARSKYIKERLAFFRDREQKLLQKREEIVSRLQEAGYEFEQLSRSNAPEFTKETIAKASALGRRLGFKEGKFAQLESIYGKELRKLNQEIAETQEALEIHKRAKPIIELQRKGIEALKRKIEKKDYSIKEVLAGADKYYLHRMYNYAAIENDPVGFQDALTDGLMSIYPNLSEVECRSMAVEIYNELMLPSSNKRHLSLEQRGAELDRKLKFETKYIADYLTKDTEQEALELARTLIPDTELAKRGMFDVDALSLQIQTVGEDAASKLADPRAAAMVRKDSKKGAETLIRLIDDVRGLTYVNPWHDTRSAVIARNLHSITKNALTSLYLGNVALARMLDMFTTTLHLGLGNYLRGCYRMGGFDVKKISRLTKDELDPFVHAVDENGGRLLFELGKEIQDEWTIVRWARNGAAFVTKLARLLDEHGKKTVGYACEEYLLRGCEKMKLGKSISGDHMNFLLHYGIDKETAKKIATEFAEHGTVQKDTKCVFANTDAWADRTAADALKAAVRKCQQECIVTPTTGATPLFFKNPIVSLFLQFKRCAFAATEKAMVPFIQALKRGEYDRCVMSCAVGGAFAYMREEAKDRLAGRERTLDEKIESALGSLDVFAYGAFMKDTFGKMDFDEQDRFANFYKILDVAPFTSAAVRTVRSAYALKKMYSGVPLNRGDLSSMKSVVPFFTFFGWQKSLNELEKQIGKDMMIASYYRDDPNWKHEGDLEKPYEIASAERVADIQRLRTAENKHRKEEREKILGNKKNKDVVYKGSEGIVAKRREGNRLVGYKIVRSEEELRKTPNPKRKGKKKKEIRTEIRKLYTKKERDDD